MQERNLTATIGEELLTEIASAFSDLSRDEKILIIMQMLQSTKEEKANA